MDRFSFWNQQRIVLISTGAVFFPGIFAACYTAGAPRAVKGLPRGKAVRFPRGRRVPLPFRHSIGR